MDERQQRIEALCPEVEKAILQDFFARMDEDYFASFSAEEIATHIKMSCRLDRRNRVQVRVNPRAVGQFDIIIVAFDYLSEFSIFCGLLSAFGLDIRSGNIYSFARQVARPFPRKIVDVFRVEIRSGESFDETKQAEFQQELQRFAQLLAAGSTEEARERLNRFLTERIETMNENLTGLVAPVDIRFDNTASAEWTVMDARSEDAFGFLYAVSNALAMRGIYIHKVKVRSANKEVRDQFFVADRWGRKIDDEQEQERLRMAVAMMKQFTRFLPEAPDPAKAMRHFDQFLDKIAETEFPDRVIRFLAGTDGMTMLAHLLGSSDFLWDDFLSIHFDELLPVLENIRSTTPAPHPFKQELHAQLASSLTNSDSFQNKRVVMNRFKDQRLFLIDAQHLLAPSATLIDFSHKLTDLAEVVIDQAVQICSSNRKTAGAFTVCGLGKFGGREMGYASDLELLFVHNATEAGADFEPIARCIVDCIEARKNSIFQIDLRLRPYGDAGAWSTSLEEFRTYYSPEGSAAAFERQALIKLRWVAGDENLGRRVEAHRNTFTYSGAPWDWENALHLRSRQIREIARPGQVNVKYGAGGIIEIEYAVQYLQLIHGKDHPELRVTGTFEAIEALRRLEIITEEEDIVLRGGYIFLRKVIDAMRIVRGAANDLVLPHQDSDEFKSLARRLGYRANNRREGAALLARDVTEWMQKVNQHYRQRFGVSGIAPS